MERHGNGHESDGAEATGSSQGVDEGRGRRLRGLQLKRRPGRAALKAASPPPVVVNLSRDDDWSACAKPADATGAAARTPVRDAPPPSLLASQPLLSSPPTPRRCWVCQADLMTMRPDAKNAHLNRCLERQGGETGATVVALRPLRAGPASTTATATTASANSWDPEDADGAPSEACPVCAQSLADMPAKSREIHINACLDGEAQAVAAVARAAAQTAARAANVACPICARSLLFSAAGAVTANVLGAATAHLKACAVQHNVPLPHLVEIAHVRPRLAKERTWLASP